VLVTVQPHATRPTSHLNGWVGFWLWALFGAALVFGLVSFIVFFLVPAIVFGVVLVRRSPWKDGPVTLGAISGVGLMLLVVAGLNWNGWQHRAAGDDTPNPFYWGGVGLCLLVAGIVLYAVRIRRS
jgi:hypothetical protein